jgi:RND family efflux transporter MFP subunit
VKTSRLIFFLLFFITITVISWQVYIRLDSIKEKTHDKAEKNRPVPVMTQVIETGSIALEYHFNGSLKAHSEFLVSPKVEGVIKSIAVNMGDSVKRGQVVALLDSAEFDQQVIQAEAELEIARANLQESKSLLKIAERELKRIDKLREQGVSSASQRDVTRAEQLAKQAHAQVAIAEQSRAKAKLETARIQRSYTAVKADWHGKDEYRLVAERFVDEGETINAHTPLLKVINLNPITAVINVTEKQYADLSSTQPVSLTTDAYPDKQFYGVIERISPIFLEKTRQAHVEIEINNSEKILKPGMFVRIKVVLRKLDKATIIPAQALTRRDNKTGIFILSEDHSRVSWHIVKPGIQQGERLQINNKNLQGHVVILGQQLLKHGSAVIVAEPSKD